MSRRLYIMRLHICDINCALQNLNKFEYRRVNAGTHVGASTICNCRRKTGPSFRLHIRSWRFDKHLDLITIAGQYLLHCSHSVCWWRCRCVVCALIKQSVYLASILPRKSRKRSMQNLIKRD